MKQTLGRFLLQPNKNFPIDCETLDYIQTNVALLQVLGNIAGDKTIVLGCEPEQNETRRKPGYVFLKTKDFPTGEIIYWEGGNISSGMYVNQETIRVEALGYEFPQAYVVRSLVAGIGSENFEWADFKDLKTPAELEDNIKKQDATIAKLAPPPLGIVQLWAGKGVPEGYELCEGQQLKISDYPELYAILGTTFNNSYSATGSRYTTTGGYFRLPDLRGRFVVGYNPNDSEYNALGKAGGEKVHTLTVSEIPAHNHGYEIYGFGSSDRNRWSGKDNHDSDTKDKFTSGNTGGGAAHENRPPFYSLAYIIRVR